MAQRRVVVTGIGPMSSLGIGQKKTWESILNTNLNIVKERYLMEDDVWGEFYLHKMRNFGIEKFKLPEKSFRYIKEMRTVKKEDIDLYYFLAVIKLALDDSSLSFDADHNDIGLILTQENPGIETLFEEIVDSAYMLSQKKRNKIPTKLELAQALYDINLEKMGYNLQTFSYLFSTAKIFDIHGYSLFINNACASGLFAIDAAARQIRSCESPAVIVAGVDNPTKIYKYLWFKRNGLYADDGIVKPFCKNADGTVFGDGGAALVLEDLEFAMGRGANIYAEYVGGGFSLEGWKIAVPNIADNFYECSFRKALKISGIKPDEVDFINPHGVGLRATDIYEARTIQNIFRNKKPFISAFKPLVGHNLGGSALLETTIGLLSLKNGFIPGTLNSDELDEELDLNLVKKNIGVDINIFAKMSCGFAGFNGVGIFRKLK